MYKEKNQRKKGNFHTCNTRGQVVQVATWSRWISRRFWRHRVVICKKTFLKGVIPINLQFGSLCFKNYYVGILWINRIWIFKLYICLKSENPMNYMNAHLFPVHRFRHFLWVPLLSARGHKIVLCVIFFNHTPRKKWTKKLKNYFKKTKKSEKLRKFQKEVWNGRFLFEISSTSRLYQLVRERHIV